MSHYMNFETAIKHRETAIEKLQNNPPANWTPEYTEANIQIMYDQIANFQDELSKENN